MNDFEQNRTIWTVGHSNRTFNEFTDILKSFNIECLADIRSLPGSRHYPHFNKEALEVKLPENNIDYFHLRDLGGRRKVKQDSINSGWHHPAFRGYADYMETSSFKEAVHELEKIATEKRTAYMCSEALWWRCHRSLVSDYLKLHGWTVFHIMGLNKVQEHTYTEPARVINGELLYSVV